MPPPESVIKVLHTKCGGIRIVGIDKRHRGHYTGGIDCRGAIECFKGASTGVVLQKRTRERGKEEKSMVVVQADEFRVVDE